MNGDAPRTTRRALPLLAGLATLAALAVSGWGAQAHAAPTGLAVLQGLDKTTARVSTFEAAVGDTVAFGALRITVRYCDRTPPEEPPESTAFMEITEVRADEDEAVEVFTGWMFASSPALSAMEHPVYDVWVLECRASSTPEDESAPE